MWCVSYCSLLSHSAVVARGLGLPTVVGVSGGLMKRLKMGMRVLLDAGMGRVTILDNQQEDNATDNQKKMNVEEDKTLMETECYNHDIILIN